MLLTFTSDVNSLSTERNIECFLTLTSIIIFVVTVACFLVFKIQHSVNFLQHLDTNLGRSTVQAISR